MQYVLAPSERARGLAHPGLRWVDRSWAWTRNTNTERTPALGSPMASDEKECCQLQQPRAAGKVGSGAALLRERDLQPHMDRLSEEICVCSGVQTGSGVSHPHVWQKGLCVMPAVLRNPVLAGCGAAENLAVCHCLRAFVYLASRAPTGPLGDRM